MNRGLFVVVEGADGSGKSTIIDSIQKTSSVEWRVLKYPNRDTAIGAKINDILQGRLVVPKPVELKFFADNRQEDKTAIITALNSGVNVIADRYMYSSVAYTMTSQYHRAIGNHPVDHFMTYGNIAKLDRGMPKPDVVLLVHGNHLASRKSSEAETKDGYNRDVLMMNFMNAVSVSGVPWTVVDNSSEADGALERVCRGVSLHLDKRLAAPRKDLLFF